MKVEYHFGQAFEFAEGEDIQGKERLRKMVEVSEENLKKLRSQVRKDKRLVASGKLSQKDLDFRNKLISYGESEIKVVSKFLRKDKQIKKYQDELLVLIEQSYKTYDTDEEKKIIKKIRYRIKQLFKIGGSMPGDLLWETWFERRWYERKIK
jgi:hypothetical protein